MTGVQTCALPISLGWVLAALTAVLLLWLLPLSVSPRAVLALGLAPLSGICVHLRAIVSAGGGR